MINLLARIAIFDIQAFLSSFVLEEKLNDFERTLCILFFQPEK